MTWPEPAGSILVELETRLRDLLGANLYGMYVYGSLAFGCYNPAWSDVDVLVVTRRRMAEGTCAAVVDALRRIGSPTRLEITFLSRANLVPWRHPCLCDLHFSRVAEVRDRLNYDLAAEITNARARGVALVGPPPEDVLPAVPEADFEQSILGDIRWARQHVDDRPGYGVLNGCRVLAYREERTIMSKAEAGSWGARSLPAQFQPLARHAAAVYAGATEQELDREHVGVFLDWVAAELEID